MFCKSGVNASRKNQKVTIFILGIIWKLSGKLSSLIGVSLGDYNESWCAGMSTAVVKHCKGAQVGAKIDPCDGHQRLRMLACQTHSITVFLHRFHALPLGASCFALATVAWVAQKGHWVFFLVVGLAAAPLVPGDGRVCHERCGRKRTPSLRCFPNCGPDSLPELLRLCELQNARPGVVA